MLVQNKFLFHHFFFSLFDTHIFTYFKYPSMVSVNIHKYEGNVPHYSLGASWTAHIAYYILAIHNAMDLEL